jgi:hypothetical protein
VARLYHWLNLAVVASLSLSLALAGCASGAASPAALRLPIIGQIVMVSPRDGWAVGRGIGESRIMHYSNGQWQVRDDGLPTYVEAGVTMLSADEGWAFVDPLPDTPSEIWHFQANAWTRAVQISTLASTPLVDTGGLGCGPGTEIHAIAASSPRDIWAVGDNGCMVHYDGTAWMVQAPMAWSLNPSSGYSSVATLPDGEVWVGGGWRGRDEIWHYSAGSWAQAYPGVDPNTGISSIAMVSPSEG